MLFQLNEIWKEEEGQRKEKRTGEDEMEENKSL